MYWSLTVGRYTLDQRGDQTWLTRDGGEGMEIKPDALEEILHQYFEETF